MTDTKELLIAWGAWAHNFEGGSCASPAQALINIAPHQDAQDIKRKRIEHAYISDEDALMVDAAVMKLKRHSKRLSALLTYYVDNEDTDMISMAMIYHVTMLRFYDGIKSRGIAERLNKYFEKRLFNQVNVEKMIERGIGIVEGAMIDSQVMDNA